MGASLPYSKRPMEQEEDNRRVCGLEIMLGVSFQHIGLLPPAWHTDPFWPHESKHVSPNRELGILVEEGGIQ